MSEDDDSHVVVSTDDLEPGDHAVVEIDGREIGVFNVDGEYHAYTNWCPHQGGPACEGALHGTTEATYDRDALDLDLEWVREDEVLLCPWHGWEFDVDSGEALHPDRSRLIAHDVRVEGDDVVVTL